LHTSETGPFEKQEVTTLSGRVLNNHPEIPEGIYLVRYMDYKTTRMFGGRKVVIRFAVAQGEYAGIPLTRYYNVDALADELKNGEEYAASDRRDLVREYWKLFPDKSGSGDIELNDYAEKLIRVRVKSTGKDGRGNNLSKGSRYSKISELLEIVPDDYEILFSDDEEG